MIKITADDIPVREFPIDSMPNLTERLGKANVDRIRYAKLACTKPEYGKKNLPNTVMAFMQDKQPGDIGCWVDDIIQGVARLDHQQTEKRPVPLSVPRLYNILQCIELINTREVTAMMAIEKRQAQKYVKAAQLVIKAIERHLTKISDSNPSG